MSSELEVGMNRDVHLITLTWSHLRMMSYMYNESLP